MSDESAAATTPVRDEGFLVGQRRPAKRVRQNGPTRQFGSLTRRVFEECLPSKARCGWVGVKLAAERLALGVTSRIKYSAKMSTAHAITRTPPITHMSSPPSCWSSSGERPHDQVVDAWTK